MEIKDRDELQKYLMESFYILRLKHGGGKKQRIHRGNCLSFSTFFSERPVRKNKATATYHVFNTLDQAVQKYLTKFSHNYIPYCPRCLNKQRKEWIKNYNSSMNKENRQKL